MKARVTRIYAAIMALAALIMLPLAALANPAVVSITAPVDGSTTYVDAFPTGVTVSGTVVHSPGTVNDMRACVTVDNDPPVCGNYVSGVGNTSSFPFAISVVIYSAGTHSFVVSADKSSGGHYGFAQVTATYLLSATICDEKDPPAIANEYLDSKDTPDAFKTIRGKIISVIAQNMNEGRYGSCNYNVTLVQSDVDALLVKLLP
ncbi:MAG TPA: hypothetical protein VFK23_05985 [Nitrospirota bacterium]|nr:hypothetical protein [Nitrospirota bacterium]